MNKTWWRTAPAPHLRAELYPLLAALYEAVIEDDRSRANNQYTKENRP